MVAGAVPPCFEDMSEHDDDKTSSAEQHQIPANQCERSWVAGFIPCI
jgi:hypothetical protein